MKNPTGAPANAQSKGKRQNPVPVKTGKASAKTGKGKSATDAATAVSKKAAVDKAVKDRDVMYIYPTDCTNPLDRKKFRHGVRAKIKAARKALAKATDAKGQKDARTALNALLQEVMTKPELV